jgi:hypothetical protein
MSGDDSSSTKKAVSSVNWPVARTHDDVVVQEVLNEVVIYDLPRDKAHALNPTAAQVYRWCDGQTSPQAMAERVAEINSLSRRQGDALVGLALKLLQQEDLVAWTGTLVPAMRSVTRRSALARVGVAALVPVVYSLVAPTPAQAQSNATTTPTATLTRTPTRTPTLTNTPGNTATPTRTPTRTATPLPPVTCIEKNDPCGVYAGVMGTCWNSNNCGSNNQGAGTCATCHGANNSYSFP